jgi:hypothetical protein
MKSLMPRSLSSLLPARVISFLAVVCFSFSVLAEKNLVERVYEAQSRDKNPVSAKTEMINQATERVSEDLIKEIIGESKYSRNKSLIQSKILKNSARYVPFSKPGELVPLTPEDGYKMTVALRVSVDDLQSLLLENGLFYESDTTPVVLPTIRLLDRVNSKTYAWWADAENGAGKAFLLKEGRSLEDALKSAFMKHNFYVLKPQVMHFTEFLPPGARAESLRKEEWQTLAQKMGAQIQIDGDLTFNKSQERSEAVTIVLKMTALQVMNSRVIAEVSRQFETEAGAFEAVVDRKLKEALESTSQDLAAQVFEAWQRGSLGASLYRLAVKGRLPLLRQEALKDALKDKVREVKNVRERLISSDGVVYEVDSALGPKDLAAKAAEIELGGGLKIVLESVTDQEAIYRVAKSTLATP